MDAGAGAEWLQAMANAVSIDCCSDGVCVSETARFSSPTIVFPRAGLPVKACPLGLKKTSEPGCQLIGLEDGMGCFEL